jgi:hypothetical protein
MARFGLDFVAGVVGGVTGYSTGAPTAFGTAGTLVGMGAKAKVQQMQGGGHFSTTQQINRTRQFAKTGYKAPPGGGYGGGYADVPDMRNKY